jgi:type I restriction enzyme S subunit
MTPSYKKTDVGAIPDAWRVHRLGDLVQGSRSIRYGIVQPGKFQANGCFMLRSQDYSKGWAGPDGMHKVSAQLETQYRNARIRRGDLVITVVGAGIGQVVIVPDWLDGTILSRSTARIAIDKDKASPSFVQAFLESPVGKRQILDCQKEGAQPVVSCPDLAKFFVVGPSLPEQRAIAEMLSDIDALLKALDRLIAKNRDLKRATMQQLLTGQTRLSGFHGEWEVKRLGASCELITKGTTPTSIGRRFTASGVTFLKAESISESGMPIPDKVAFIDAKTHKLLNRSQLKEDDLLISIAGVLGRVGRVSQDILPANVNQALAIIRLGKSSELERIFLFFSLHSPMTMKQITDVNVQAAQANISLQNVRDLEINVPPTLLEQAAIAKVLSEMDAELAGLEQRREKTRALKQGMVQEVLTGRTRLISAQESYS